MDLVRIAQNAYVQMGTALFQTSYLVAILLPQKEGFKFQALYRPKSPDLNFPKSLKNDQF